MGRKPAKIKKFTITGLKEKGGLKMIDFDHMNKALKCARARLILVQTKHSSGTTDTLKSTIKLYFFQRGTAKESTKLKI